MKLRLVSALVCLAGLVGLVSACTHNPHRNDWRAPAAPTTCTMDADCHGGTCAIEVGASQGTCSAPSFAPGAGADGGAAPGTSPGPNVQPLSTDIQL